jgi:large subunit ribosomal protein L4
MAKVAVFDKTNKKVGDVELSEKIFNAPINESLIYYSVKHYLAKGRAGTSSTKSRGEVSGSGRKMWRQKGTGRARAGQIRNPVWRHGGIVFGPKPRSYDYHLPKKMKYGALCSVLTQRYKSNQVTVLDNLDLEAAKTREIVKIMDSFSVSGKFLLVDDIENKNLMLSVRNIPHGKALGGYGLNVYDLLKYDNLFLTRKALGQIEEVLG